MDREAAIIEARYLVASASGNVANVSAQIARALAWQSGRENSTIDALEVALQHLAVVQRQLADAIAEVRIATRKDS